MGPDCSFLSSQQHFILILYGFINQECVVLPAIDTRGKLESAPRFERHWDIELHAYIDSLLGTEATDVYIVVIVRDFTQMCDPRQCTREILLMFHGERFRVPGVKLSNNHTSCANFGSLYESIIYIRPLLYFVDIFQVGNMKA